MKMLTILLFIILQSLSSVQSLNCSDVRQSNGFGLYVRREPNGSRSYWIHNKKGSEWELYLNETNGLIDIERISNESGHDRSVTIGFSNFVRFKHSSTTDNHRKHWFFVSHNCLKYAKSDLINCDVTQTEEHSNELLRSKVHQRLMYDNLLIFKTYPILNDTPLANHWMAYNRYEKNRRFQLGLYNIESFDYDLYTERKRLPDIAFIRQMNDSLFSQIESMLDYNLRGMTGHMLWLNIDHKHYYCFQPEGQSLSEQVLILILID